MLGPPESSRLASHLTVNSLTSGKASAMGTSGRPYSAHHTSRYSGVLGASSSKLYVDRVSKQPHKVCVLVTATLQMRNLRDPEKSSNFPKSHSQEGEAAGLQPSSSTPKPTLVFHQEERNSIQPETKHMTSETGSPQYRANALFPETSATVFSAAGCGTSSPEQEPGGHGIPSANHLHLLAA